MTFATLVRQFFRELFGSRMTDHLLEESAMTRSAYETRIQELKQQILDLKTDKQLLQSKVTQLETVVLPYTSRAGAELVRTVNPQAPKPNFGVSFEDAPKTSWQLAQEEFNKIENDAANAVGAN